MERFTANGSHQQRPTLHTKPRHTREPHFTSHLLPLAPTRDHHLRRLPDGTELSVFDANRYFKETPDQTEDRRQKKGLWRSQRGAPTDPPPRSGGIAAKTSPLSNHKRRPLSTCAWPLVVSCPCSRKEAVDVEEKYSTHPTSPHHLYLEGIGSGSLNKKEAKATVEETETSVFAAATGSEKVGSPTDHELGLEVEDMAKLRLVPESWIYRQDLFLGSSLLLRHEAVRFAIPFSYGKRTVGTPLRTPSPHDDPTRVSLEVFQPVEESSVTPRESSDLRRLGTTPLFAGDGGPRRSSTFLPASPAARVALVEEELASDSSSDLFEIESFSTQATPSRPGGSSLDGTVATARAMRTPAAGSSSATDSRHELCPPAGSAGGDGMWRWRCEEGRAAAGQRQKHSKDERPRHPTMGASDAGPVRAISLAALARAPAPPASMANARAGR